MRIDLLIFWILIFLEALRKRILDAFLVRFNLGILGAYLYGWL